MTESKPTSGPWTAGREINETGLRAKIRGKSGIAIYHNGSHVGTWIDNETDGWANARLIAAAPELLAILELAERYMGHPDVQAIPFALAAECVHDRIVAAIKRATPVVKNQTEELNAATQKGRAK